ncbi:MAG: hypothetical protein JXN60_03925, partial [Lentisphaerae bacterium]|nr:hypothetical protein [Lentisphaerota bacterium]
MIRPHILTVLTILMLGCSRSEHTVKGSTGAPEQLQETTVQRLPTDILADVDGFTLTRAAADAQVASYLGSNTVHFS